MKVSVEIDVNPADDDFCVMGDKRCNRMIIHFKPAPLACPTWCAVFDKELNTYGGCVARCIECTLAEREAKNDCKNNADA